MSDGKHVAIVDVFYWVPQGALRSQLTQVLTALHTDHFQSSAASASSPQAPSS